jgi:hypothetical protein
MLLLTTGQRQRQLEGEQPAVSAVCIEHSTQLLCIASFFFFDSVCFSIALIHPVSITITTTAHSMQQDGQILLHLV